MSLATVSTLQSAGPLLISPDASPDGGVVLFVADVSAARILAFELPPEDPAPAGEIRVDRLGAKLASLLGAERDDVVIRGIATHPASHAAYLSVARGRGRQRHDGDADARQKALWNQARPADVNQVCPASSASCSAGTAC